MDVEAVTDEIPSNALSCSPLIEISNLQEEFWEFSIYVKAVWKGKTYGIFANNEFEKGLEEPEYENKDIKISSHQEEMYPALRKIVFLRRSRQLEPFRQTIHYIFKWKNLCRWFLKGLLYAHKNTWPVMQNGPYHAC